MELDLPVAYQPLFEPARYKVCYGGRGSAKSWSIAIALICMSLSKTLRIFCFREIQNSISSSVYAMLYDLIRMFGLSKYFEVKKTYIFCRVTGSYFFFKGVLRNATSIKSAEGIDIAWLEEAERFSQESLDILIPTIRKKGSEIWISFNPDNKDDPIMAFVNSPRADQITLKTSWRDNPFLSNELLAEKDWMQVNDPDKYQWIWEGECRTVSDSLIFKDKFQELFFEITPNEFGGDKIARNGRAFYYGADFGFNDPATLVRCFIHDECLYIDHESYSVKCDTDKLPELYEKVPESRLWRIGADNSRPDTIRHLQARGFNVYGADKGPSSVEEGVAFLRSFKKIYIHPRCKHVLEEFKTYSYVIDKLTGNPTPDIEDKHNHTIDAIRYALREVMKNKRFATMQIKGV
jgi:phage terminase large subunit